MTPYMTPKLLAAIDAMDTALDNLMHGCPELHLAAYDQAQAEYRAALAREMGIAEQDLLTWYERELETPLAERYDGGNDVDLDL